MNWTKTTHCTLCCLVLIHTNHTVATRYAVDLIQASARGGRATGHPSVANNNNSNLQKCCVQILN